MSADHLNVRPLIVGAGGLVGRLLTERFESRYPHTVSATRAELDVTDRWRTEAELERIQPTVVINGAAMADVDACERDPEKAMQVNAVGPAHLAQACRSAGVRLIHLSTDYVFDGEIPAGVEYDEADQPNPVNTYARTKCAGEDAVLECLADAVVLRISFVFGPGRPTFIDKIATAALNTRESIPIVDGWFTKPSFNLDLVRAIEEIVASDITGVWHFANGPVCSRYQFARSILQLVGQDPDRVKPVPVSSLTLPARRPPRTPLSTARFAARFGRQPRSWTEWAGPYLAAQSSESPR
ncbi:MAG: dTDP-4-dehydrorhamnose reductase [Acidobacteriota bacterium]